MFVKMIHVQNGNEEEKGSNIKPRLSKSEIVSEANKINFLSNYGYMIHLSVFQ